MSELAGLREEISDLTKELQQTRRELAELNGRLNAQCPAHAEKLIRLDTDLLREQVRREEQMKSLSNRMWIFISAFTMSLATTVMYFLKGDK